MRLKSILVFLFVFGLITPSSIMGEETFKLSIADGQFVPCEEDNCLQKIGNKIEITDNCSAVILVSCDDSDICSEIKLYKGEKNSKSKIEIPMKKKISSTERVFGPIDKNLLTSNDQTEYLIYRKDKYLNSFDLEPEESQQSPKKALDNPQISVKNIADLLPDVICDQGDKLGYYPEDNCKESMTGKRVVRAVIVVDPLGNVIDKAYPFQFDENDQLQVFVKAKPELLKILHVERSSPFRNPNVVRVFGADAADILLPQAKGDRECYRSFIIDNFEPGKGSIDINFIENNKPVKIGSFDIQVNPLYSGAFNLGLVKTELIEPEFRVRLDGENRIIEKSNKDDDDYLYALMYTPYVWGKRDLEKSDKKESFLYRPWTHINPTFGIVPEDIAKHALVGLSFDLPAGVLITYGMHFREIEKLSGNYKVGDTLTEDQIPTHESWEDDTFVAVSFDMRVMTKLLKGLFTEQVEN